MSAISTTVLLFECGQNLVNKNLIESKHYRNVNLIKPNEKKILAALCQA